MLTLTLLRHAKSSWDDPALKDFDRPLNDRGREAAPVMGAEMRRQGLRPDHVLCSPSQRTRQTLDFLRQALPALKALGPADEPKALYHASPVILFRTLHALPETVRHCLLIGHNPGLHQLAVWLIGRGPASKRRVLEEKLPTAGLVVMTFEVTRWADIQPGNGQLRLFARPRDVM
jgi:phosphohistidine phosphatase